MVKSFFRTMIEEKNLMGEILTIEHNGFIHIMEVPVLLSLIEKTSEEEKVKIKKDFSIIDFRNGNLMNYLKFLAAAYISNNYESGVTSDNETNVR